MGAQPRPERGEAEVGAVTDRGPVTLQVGGLQAPGQNVPRRSGPGTAPKALRWEGARCAPGAEVGGQVGHSLAERTLSPGGRTSRHPAGQAGWDPCFEQ